MFRDCVISPTKIKSEGSEYVTALKCLNQTILFYLLPRKLYSPETNWRQTAKNASLEQSTRSNFIPMPLWFCVIHEIVDFKNVIFSSILAMGIVRKNCVVKLSLRAGTQLWTFIAQVPLLLQADLLLLRISEFNNEVARFVNSQLVSRFLRVEIVSFLFANCCSFTQCHSVLSGPY